MAVLSHQEQPRPAYSNSLNMVFRNDFGGQVMFVGDMNTSYVILSHSENFVVSSNVWETSVSVLVMEQWKVYVWVWLELGSENEIKCSPLLTLTRVFLPAGAKQVTHCNVVNILQVCNSSFLLMYSNRRQRKIFWSAANVTFAVPDSFMWGSTW